MPMPDFLAPYASLLKWLLIVLLLAATFIGGCQHGQARNAQTVHDKNIALLKAASALQDAAGVLRAVNAQAEFEVAAAAAQAERAAAALRLAERERDRYLEQLGAIDADIQRAKRDPDCRRALEAQVCAVLL